VKTLTLDRMHSELSVKMEGSNRTHETLWERLWLRSFHVVPAVVAQNPRSEMQALNPTISPQSEPIPPWTSPRAV